MKIKVYLLLVICLIAANSLTADKLDTTYQNITNAYAELDSWQAEIHQTNYFSQVKTTLKSEGDLYYQKNRLAIHYYKPNVQSIIIKDSLITVYDKASKSVVRSRLTSSIQSLNPVEIVKSYWQKSEKTTTIKAGKVHIVLKPRKDKQIREISFVSDPLSGYINSLTYKDMHGNAVSLEFTGIKVNKSIPVSVWKLDLPKDVKVYNR